MITAADYRLSAARAAHAHLLYLHDALRVQIIHAWLIENRPHPKARVVDSLLSDFRMKGSRVSLEDIETVVYRHPGELA